jgi:hypothetical protein
VLSPDGRVLACNDSKGTLKLVDVPARKTLYEKRQFVRLIAVSDGDQFPRAYAGDLGEAGIEFSPDGRFLMAGANPNEVGLYERDKGIQAVVTIHPK